MLRENSTWQNGVKIAAEIIDTDAGTITFEDRGVVTGTRPLTPAELAMYAPPEPTAEERLAQAKTVLGQISALPAPVLTADVVDLLDDLRGVL